MSTPCRILIFKKFCIPVSMSVLYPYPCPCPYNLDYKIQKHWMEGAQPVANKYNCKGWISIHFFHHSHNIIAHSLQIWKYQFSWVDYDKIIYLKGGKKGLNYMTRGMHFLLLIYTPQQKGRVHTWWQGNALASQPLPFNSCSWLMPINPSMNLLTSYSIT